MPDPAPTTPTTTPATTTDTPAPTPPQPSADPPKAPATPPAAPPAPPVAPASTTEDNREPHWLAARLERERRTMLRDMGVDNPDDVKAALADLKKRREAEMTEAELLKSRVAELEKSSSDRDELHATVTDLASAKLAALSEAQRNAVLKIAGDSARKQLDAITVLSATWAPDAPPTDGGTGDAPTATAPTAPIPAPATTAQTAPAPPPTPATATENRLATYEKLLTDNPMAAATYRHRYRVEIQKAKDART